MNSKNINLFSTFFPLNYKNINKNFVSKNNSPTNISKEKIDLMKINKRINDDNISFAFFNSGKFKTKNDMNNSSLSINRGQILPKKNDIIPLIQYNSIDANHMIYKNFSEQDIKNKKQIKLNFNKKKFDINYLEKNNIIFNKNRNYFSKESINILKYLNYKNLISKNELNKVNKDKYSNIKIKKLNNSNDNKFDIQVRNNQEGLNNYLTVYNFKSYKLESKMIPKNKTKVNCLIKRNFFSLPKMIDKLQKTKESNININTLYEKEKNNKMKTFFQTRSTNELFIPKTIFNKTKIINKYTSKIKKIKNNKKISIEVLSIPGITLNKEKINQDTYMILPNNILSENNLSESPNLNIFGIFDGHGEFGDIVSNEIKNNFLEYFNKLNYNSNENYDKLCNNNYKEIYSLFNQIDKKLHKKYNSKNTCYNSGTTANIILLFKNKIISINIGDSKSILIAGNNNEIIQLNKCHNPEREDEKKRIEKNGGEVGRVNWADYGPQRVWYKGKIYPGLSISRSFGDFISEPLGVFSVPEIKEFDIDYKKNKIMVIGTDGIWEFLSNEKVRDIVIPYYEENTIHGGINKLIDVASKMWNIKNPKYIDDLSVILIFF